MKKRIWLFILIGVLVTALVVLFFCSTHRSTLAHRNEGKHIDTYKNQAEEVLKTSAALKSTYGSDITVVFTDNVSWHHDDTRSALDMYAEFFWADPDESIEEFSADIEYMTLSADINGDPYEVRLEKGDDGLLSKVSATDADGNAVDLSSKTASTRIFLRDKYTAEIETAYDADADLPEYQSTAGMCELNDKYAKRWQEIADEYYDKLMAYEYDLNGLEISYYNVEEFRAALKRMKTAHDTYSKEMEENYSDVTMYVFGAGSLCGPVNAHYCYEKEKAWAVEILNICDMLGIE